MRYHDVIQTLVTIKKQNVVSHQSNSDDKIKTNTCDGSVTFAEFRRRSSRVQSHSIEYSPPSPSPSVTQTTNNDASFGKGVSVSGLCGAHRSIFIWLEMFFDASYIPP